MSVWGDLRETVRERVAQHRNRHFMEAAMAAAALVAASDGRVSFSERVALDRFLDSCADLAVFDPHEAVDLFNACITRIQEQGRAGREACLSQVGRMADDPTHAGLVVRVALALCEADGEFTDAELTEVLAICDRLGLDAEAFVTDG